MRIYGYEAVKFIAKTAAVSSQAPMKKHWAT